MRLMHVDTCTKGVKSISKMLSTYFVETLKENIPDLVVDYLDLSIETPAYIPVNERTLDIKTSLENIDVLCARVLMSDFLVFAMPTYNFSAPPSFSAFLDTLVHQVLTYNNHENGAKKVNLKRQKLIVITTRENDLSSRFSTFEDMDAHSKTLLAPFEFLGVETPYFVDVQPLHVSDPVAKMNTIIRAYDELNKLALVFTSDI